jgi:hypothetical protein
MREINARSSRKAKAGIETSIHNRTKVRVYPGKFLSAGTKRGLDSRHSSNDPEPLRQPGPEKDQPSNRLAN